MPNVFKPSGERDIRSFEKRFHYSIVSLTILYASIIATILFISGLTTYTAFSDRVGRRFIDVVSPEMQQRFLIRRYPTAEEVRADLTAALFLVNGGLFIFATFLSYFLAKATLWPIKDAYEKQQRFLSDASHELRTPVAILQADLENQLITYNTKELQGMVNSHLEEVKRMTNIINDLLVVSRFDQDIPENIEKTHIKILELLKETINRFKPLAQKNDVIINFDENKNKDLEVLSNKETLIKIFSNVIKNAIVYNKKGGEIAVVLSGDNNNVEVLVRDTGVGISQENIPKIFERFYRVDKSRSRKTGGSGLGLSIVRESLESLGGSIEIESEIDQGTTVKITLPK